jgi:hypothetical protein
MDDKALQFRILLETLLKDMKLGPSGGQGVRSERDVFDPATANDKGSHPVL